MERKPKIRNIRKPISRSLRGSETRLSGAELGTIEHLRAVAEFDSTGIETDAELRQRLSEIGAISSIAIAALQHGRDLQRITPSWGLLIGGREDPSFELKLWPGLGLDEAFRIKENGEPNGFTAWARDALVKGRPAGQVFLNVRTDLSPVEQRLEPTVDAWASGSGFRFEHESGSKDDPEALADIVRFVARKTVEAIS